MLPFLVIHSAHAGAAHRQPNPSPWANLPVSALSAVSASFAVLSEAEGSHITPFFVAFPYVSAVSPLSTVFTHFDRGGRVGTFSAFRRSDFSTCRLSSTISRIFNSLLPL